MLLGAIQFYVLSSSQLISLLLITPAGVNTVHLSNLKHLVLDLKTDTQGQKVNSFQLILKICVH